MPMYLTTNTPGTNDQQLCILNLFEILLAIRADNRSISLHCFTLSTQIIETLQRNVVRNEGSNSRVRGRKGCFQRKCVAKYISKYDGAL